MRNIHELGAVFRSAIFSRSCMNKKAIFSDPELERDNPLKFKIHAGLGSGELLSFFIGGVNNRFEYVVCGEPLLQLQQTVQLSQQREIVISEESYQLVKDHIDIEPRNNCFLVKSILIKSPPTVSAIVRENSKSQMASMRNVNGLNMQYLQQFVQRGVVARLVRGQSEWIAEYRYCTVLFIAVPSFQYVKGQGVDVPALDDVFNKIQEIIYKLDGEIRQFLFDDKGAQCIAAFGLPPFSHEDDALRAISAALQIINSSQQPIAIGIASGRLEKNVEC